MRAFSATGAVRAAIVGLVIVFAWIGFAQARDGAEHRIVRRGHHERFAGAHGSTVAGRESVRRDRSGIDSRTLRRWREPGRRFAADRSFRSHEEIRRHRLDRRWNRRAVRDYRAYHPRRHGWNGPRERGITITRGGDYYGGGLSAWHEPGNGTYFGVDRTGYDDVTERYERRSGSRVLIVDPRTSNRSCSFEAGVCVIRGR